MKSEKIKLLNGGQNATNVPKTIIVKLQNNPVNLMILTSNLHKNNVVLLQMFGPYNHEMIVYVK